jgi:hypothetical protein
MFRHPAIWIAALVGCVAMRTSALANDLDRDEEVVFFPTAALFDPSAPTFKFFIHGWCYEPEHDSIRRQWALDKLVEEFDLGKDAAVEATFRERARRFIVDNERDQKLILRVGPRDVPLGATEPNGHVRAFLSLPTTEAKRMLTPHGAAAATIDYRLVTRSGDPRVFTGRVHLVGPEGWSVVSDIDDTIKVSNVLDKEELLRNTLLRPFQAVPGMAKAYQGWEREGAAFHYLSGSPWQLYPPLAEFGDKEKFPRGSFQLRYFRLQDGSAQTMLGAPEVFKRQSIESLFTDFPRRRFALVGDTGEKDPEVYGETARRHPEQVRLIALRNITEETASNARLTAALKGVPAERIVLFREASELRSLADLAK